MSVKMNRSFTRTIRKIEHRVERQLSEEQMVPILMNEHSLEHEDAKKIASIIAGSRGPHRRHTIDFHGRRVRWLKVRNTIHQQSTYI